MSLGTQEPYTAREAAPAESDTSMPAALEQLFKAALDVILGDDTNAPLKKAGTQSLTPGASSSADIDPKSSGSVTKEGCIIILQNQGSTDVTVHGQRLKPGQQFVLPTHSMLARVTSDDGHFSVTNESGSSAADVQASFLQ